MKNRLSYLFLYLSFFIYSFSIVFSKMASKQDFLSVKYMICYSALIFVLAIYAILWQQILKVIPLSIAMANKPVVLIFTLLWSYFLFKEHISMKTLIGILIILIGLFIVGKSGYER